MPKRNTVAERCSCFLYKRHSSAREGSNKETAATVCNAATPEPPAPDTLTPRQGRVLDALADFAKAQGRRRQGPPRRAVAGLGPPRGATTKTDGPTTGESGERGR